MMVSGVMFGISTLVTIAFGYALIAEPARLTEVWLWLRGLPMIVQIVAWLLLLPWMIALWVWTQPWAPGIRIAVVVLLLVGAELALFPWKR